MNKRVIFPKILLLTFVALCLYSCSTKHADLYAPGLASINIIDRNGLSETMTSKDRLAQYERTNFLAPQPYQKVMRVYSRLPNGDIKACITTYHSNGQVKQYLEILNNRAYGNYCEWYENGQLKVEACIIGGAGDVGSAAEKTWLFDGLCKAWDADGSLEAEIVYSKGILDGCSLYYHRNGSIWKKVPYNKGEVEGVEEIFLEDGTLLQANEYRQNERSGLSIRYWNPDEVASREDFYKGRLINGAYYNHNKNEVCRVVDGNGVKAIFGRRHVAELRDIRNGEIDGKIQVFNEDGALFNQFYVKNGMKHGEEIEYYEKVPGQKKDMPKLSLSWNEGVIQGNVKTWYPNGTQESQREMSKNQRNGLSTAWYRDGSLMMIEEYDHDKLVKGKYLKKGVTLPVSQIHDGNGEATLFDPDGVFLRKIEYHNGLPSM